MNLFILKEVSVLFKKYKKISFIGRIDDNLIQMRLDNQNFYINLEKSKSNIFCDDDYVLPMKKYKAPFDLILQKYALRANVLDCEIDGNNRILKISLRKKLEYKILDSNLHLEFTGRYTNAILVDSKNIILESLRKISQNIRIIKPGKYLANLPQQNNFTHKKIDYCGDILDFLYLENKKSKEVSLLKLKDSNINLLTNKKNKLLSLLQSLPNEEELILESKKYYETGNLMLNSKDFNVRGDWIILRDYENNEVKISFDLDSLSRKNSKKNLINESFKKYKKLKLKLNNISLQRENLRERISFIESQILFIENAKNISDIRLMQSQKSPHKKEIQKDSYESFFIDDVKISIGKNEKENISLLKNARANDTWMHIRDIPSSHLIIKSSRNLRDEIINKAADILLTFCKVRGENLLIDYTKRKHVKMKDGANVVYSNYNTISAKNIK